MSTYNGKINYTYLEKPCRNFNVFGNLVITDPVDGHEKFVLSDDFIILIDLTNGKAEKIEKPMPGFAWAIFFYNNERLIVGTVANTEFGFSYIYNLNLMTRKWEEPLMVENEQYIWNFVLGSDGMLYGGTWPGCSLLQYNPEKNVVRNLGRASNEDNLYARNVYGGYNGYVLIECCFDNPQMIIYDFKTSIFRRLGTKSAILRELDSEYICTLTGEELNFYHPETFEELNKEEFISKLTPITDLWKKQFVSQGISYGAVCSDSLMSRTMHHKYKTPIFHIKCTKNGDAVGIRGQDYFIDRGDSTVINLVRIPIEPPKTKIMELIPDEKGFIWGSCDLGQTIFKYNPIDGSFWNSGSVCTTGGEVIGMAIINEKLFMASYSLGDHIVYDQNEPWDQINNVNPQRLESVAPLLCRPEARSIVGPDGAFWTGWWAAYGKYGGGISRIDPDTLQVKSWYDPIPEQNIVGFACDNNYLYISTSTEADGLTDKEDSFQLAVMDLNCRVVNKVVFKLGEIPGRIAVSDDLVIVSVNDELRFYEIVSLKYRGNILLDERCRKIVPYNDKLIAAFCTKKVVFIDPKQLSMEFDCVLPKECEEEFRFSACSVPNGNLYFSAGPSLYRLNID